MSSFYFYTGILSALYAGFAGLRYYSLSGSQLVSASKAKKMIRSGEIKTVVDVRSKVEWDFGHYPGAVHMPVGSITKAKVDKLPNGGILTYCNTGNRARSAAEMIMSHGRKNVYYIDGTYKSII